jgi:Protein of unknown function (DUF3047)
MRMEYASRWAVIAAAINLAACSHVVQDVLLKAEAKPVHTSVADVAAVPETRVEKKDFSAGWRHFKLPGKPATIYDFVRKDGRDAMTAKAGFSVSMMRRDVSIDAAKLDTVNFSWQVPELIAGADLAERDFDDSPARIVLTFEGDKSKFSAKNAMLSEVAEALSGEPLPYATLMYVWCNKRQPGSVVINPRTDRIRSVVVESGEKNLRHWLDYQRNIRADFEKAFGEAPGNLISVGIMTDSDNTKTQTAAAYGKVYFGKAIER